jgi:hypothetical protein
MFVAVIKGVMIILLFSWTIPWFGPIFYVFISIGISLGGLMRVIPITLEK